MKVEDPADTPETDAEDWAMPPEFVTVAGQRFFEQQERDLHFIASDRRFLEEFRALVGKVARAVLPDKDPETAFPSLYDQVARLDRAATYNDRARAELVAKCYMDNYLTYVSEFISEVFKARPEMLRSAETIRLDDVLQHESIEDLVAWIADERVNRLSYKGFGEIEEFVRKRFSIELVDNPQHRRHLVQSIAVRNLLVHRRGLVDFRFLSVLNSEHFDSNDYQIGERLPKTNNYESLPAIVAGVRHIEGELVRKFKIPMSLFKTAWPSFEELESEKSSPAEAAGNLPT